MQDTEINLTYMGVDIKYEEHGNRWTFTLRGRDKSASSLKEAKEIISKPAKKKSEFKRFEAWKIGYGSVRPESVEVTSVVEEGRYGGPRVRVKSKEGISESSVNVIFPKNAINDELIRQILVVCDDRDAIEKKLEALKEKLKPCKIEPEEQPA